MYIAYIQYSKIQLPLYLYKIFYTVSCARIVANIIFQISKAALSLATRRRIVDRAFLINEFHLCACNYDKESQPRIKIRVADCSTPSRGGTTEANFEQIFFLIPFSSFLSSHDIARI